MNLAKSLIAAGIVLLPSLGIARDEAAPDMELLEFLGGFETARGKPVDPLAFADYPAREKTKEAPDTSKKGAKRIRKPQKSEQKERTDEKLR
jgi:hypothetical protein